MRVIIHNFLTYLLIFLVCIIVFSCTHDRFFSIQENNRLVHIEKLNNKYTFIRSGNPFFVKGAAGVSNLQELKEAGGNTIRLYDTVNLKVFLEQAYKFKLAVIVDIPLPHYTKESDFYNGGESFKQSFKKIENTVNRYKSHPALLSWNLGNEIYPENADPGFYTYFNILLDLIHTVDKNHPVSTTIARRKTLLTIQSKSPDLDFLSINIFGALSSLEQTLLGAHYFWDGPYIISEWGINGPWESPTTTWDAPVEIASNYKAVQIKDRYENFINEHDDRLLGSLAFYWGEKYEQTSTWFNIIEDKKYTTEVAYALSHVWNGRNDIDYNYKGVRIDSILINGEKIVLENGKISSGNLILPSNKIQKASVNISNISNALDLTYTWKIEKESFSYIGTNKEPSDYTSKGVHFQNSHDIEFISPSQEGGYRLYVYITDGSNNLVTANYPFYILEI